MKLLGFIGSQRVGGNTEILVEEMLKGASDAGAETKSFNLDKMAITPCKACQHCKESGGECATDDDMQEIYKELKEADAFILGSPVYMWQMSSQAKLFTDRLYALYLTDFEEKYGKKDMALVFSQGNPDESLFSDYYNSTRNMFEFLGYNVAGMLASYGNQAPGDVKNKADVLEKAREIGKKLAES